MRDEKKTYFKLKTYMVYTTEEFERLYERNNTSELYERKEKEKWLANYIYEIISNIDKLPAIWEAVYETNAELNYKSLAQMFCKYCNPTE